MLAVKMCCYFKNSDYLQKILESFSTFDVTNLKVSFKEEDVDQFDIKQILNYDYLEGKRKIEIPNYR